MRSRRARDRRGLLGEAGNTSRRKVMVGGAGIKRFDEARVRAGRQTNRGHCRRVIRINFGARMAKIFRENSDSLVATHIRKVMLNGLRSGVRSGVHYDLSFAFMHFLNTAIIYMNRPRPQVLDEQTKEALKQQLPRLVKQEADKRGISNYQRQITVNIARQCIERGECSNNELLHADIIDTLSNLKPDIVQGNAALWKKLKNFFKDSGQYLSTHFEKVKNFFKKLNPFSFEVMSQDRLAALKWWPAPPLFAPNFLRRTRARPPFLATPGAYIIESMKSKVVLQNLTTKQSLRKVLEFDYLSAYAHSVAPSFTEVEELPRIYNWYEHPILVEIIRRIEFVFSELGYTPRLDSPFSALASRYSHEKFWPSWPKN